MDITKPNFVEWTEIIKYDRNPNKTTSEAIAEALEQAYNQGYQLGLNNGWAIEQDKETNNG